MEVRSVKRDTLFGDLKQGETFKLLDEMATGEVFMKTDDSPSCNAVSLAGMTYRIYVGREVCRVKGYFQEEG